MEYVTAEVLKHWFAGQRTMYCKEKDWSKSGAGQPQLTARQKWVLNKWAFVKTHIVLKRRWQQLWVRVFYH